MGDDAFDGPELAEKLSKLNSSKQSIECILFVCEYYTSCIFYLIIFWDKIQLTNLRSDLVAGDFLPISIVNLLVALLLTLKSYNQCSSPRGDKNY